MGYTDSINALKRDIAAGKVTVTIENGVYTFAGKTYQHKDFLKAELSGTDFRFDRDAKVWRVSEDSMYSADKAFVAELISEQ